MENINKIEKKYNFPDEFTEAMLTSYTILRGVNNCNALTSDDWDYPLPPCSYAAQVRKGGIDHQCRRQYESQRGIHE